MEKVSIIIPSYKGSESLLRAVDSALAQDYPDLEVLVVDDNDPDTEFRQKTGQMMEKYASDSRVVYLKHEKNKNGAAARNTGLAASTGSFLCFLDDDDYILPERVSLAVQALADHPEADIVFMNVKKEYPGGKEVIVSEPPVISSEAIMKNAGLMGTGSNLLFTRRVYETIGGFQEKYLRYQDVEFLGRTLSKFRAVWVGRVCIVKSYNGVNNRPNIYRLAKMQDYLHEDMEEKMGITDAKLIRSVCISHANSLFMKSMSGQTSREEVEFAKKRLTALRKLNRKERLCYVLYRISPKLYRAVRDKVS